MAEDSDPPVAERVYYKHVETGQRAYVVMRNGVEKLRLDHGPNSDVVVGLNTVDWTIDKEHRPINQTHLTQVAFEADRALCRVLALHKESRIQWIDLSDKERIRFMKGGPGDEHPLRARLYVYIRAALDPYASK